MDIYAVDIDAYGDGGRLDPYRIGAPRTAYNIFGINKTVLLPDCEESHQLLGQWFLDNLPLKAQIVSKDNPLIQDSDDYPRQDNNWLSRTMFVKLDGWELVAIQDGYERKMIIYFRQTKHKGKA